MILNLPEFVLNTTGYVLNLAGFVLNTTGYVLNSIGRALNTTDFFLNRLYFIMMAMKRVSDKIPLNIPCSTKVVKF